MASPDQLPESISARDVLAGKPVPMDVRFHVRILRGPMPTDLPGIPRATAEKIAQSQDQIYEWLAAAAENRAAFLTDTVGSLRKIGIPFTPDEEKLLADIQAEARKKDVSPPSARISEFTVELGDAPRPEGPAPAE